MRENFSIYTRIKGDLVFYKLSLSGLSIHNVSRILSQPRTQMATKCGLRRAVQSVWQPITNDQTSHLHRDPAADLNNWNPKSHDGSPQYQWSGLVQPQPPSVCIVLRYGAPTRPGSFAGSAAATGCVVSTLSTHVSRFITGPGRGHRTATSSVARNINIRTNNGGLTAHRDLLNICYDQHIR